MAAATEYKVRRLRRLGETCCTKTMACCGVTRFLCDNEAWLCVLGLLCVINEFLADRTNGRAIGTVLRLSVVCDVMYCG